MTNSQRLASVRARLLQWLADQQVGGDQDAENPILSETILIRNEFYCGRRFHTATHQAVWFIEEDELKIYQGSGELACVLSGDELTLESPPQDSAASAASSEYPGPADVIKLPSPNPQSDDSEGEIRRAA